MEELMFRNSEGADIEIWHRSYEELHGITLCCVIQNEEKEIRDFLEYHKPYVNSIAIIDGGSSDRTIEFATMLADDIQIKTFDGHYSNQANRVLEMAKTDWILLMDCDERLEPDSLKNLGNLINQETYDCYSFPRKNIIDGKVDVSHGVDYQERLFRSYCRRVRPVHGEVVGYKNKKELANEDGNFIVHIKNNSRHEARNRGYLMYEYKFRHELGEPGAQTKSTFETKYPHLKESNFFIKK
jgi:glycosyltransferase involved in cell wall biosynthesis